MPGHAHAARAHLGSSLATHRHGRGIPALGPVVGVIGRAVPAAGFPEAVPAAVGRPAAFAAVALQPAHRVAAAICCGVRKLLRFDFNNSIPRVCCFVFIKPILGNRYGPGVIP